MVAVITTQEFLAGASVLGGSLTTHLPYTFSHLSLQIVCPDFEGTLTLPILELDSRMESGTVVIRTAIDSDSTVVLTLTGKVSEEDEKFEIQEVGLSIETTTKLAHSDFVLASLKAMLVLSERVFVQIPELELDLDLSFEAPLLDTSETLKRRQIAYRIMVIEKATGYEFELPLEISGQQVSEISLIYHAVVERVFDLPLEFFNYAVPATREVLERLNDCNNLSSVRFGPDPIVRDLFGRQISLGQGFLTIEDKVFEDFTKVQRELARYDGHLVKIVVRSRSGHARYELPNAPRLPVDSWDSRIQGLINLEAQLDSRLVDRYHELAASTLEGLTEQEKLEISTRPETGEAFLINDSQVEID